MIGVLTDAADLKGMRVPAIAVLGACALVVSGGAVAANAERVQVRLTAADQALARAAGLQARDLGSAPGWRGGQQKPDFSATTCPDYAPRQADLVVTGAATTSYTYAGAMTVFSDVWVLKTTRMVKLDWQRTVKHPAFVRCARSEVARGLGRGQRIVSVRRLAVPRLGSMTSGVRIRWIVSSRGRRVQLLSDVIMFGRGRTETTLMLTAPAAGKAALVGAERHLARILYARAR